MTVLADGQKIPMLITMRDEKRVTGIKKLISPGSSQMSWLSQEDQVSQVLLIDQKSGKWCRWTDG
jgi:hypothetical protein